MEAKKYLYAAVGAPVVAGRALQGRLVVIREKVADATASVTKETHGRVDEWAVEGEKAIDKLSEGTMVDELTAKVDFDQVQEQVSKLRDQLEDMLETWRANFRPAEKAEAVRVPVEEKPAPAPKAAPAKPATRTAAAKKPAAKKPAAKKPAAKKPAAKPAAKATEAKAS